MIKAIHTNKAPAAIYPYSQAMVANGFIFCSGQIGLNPKNGNLVVGLENQTRQVINNLKEVLKASDSDLDFVVKTTIYLKNISDFMSVNSIYGEYFSTHKPARSTFEVAALPKGALIEIDAIAIKKE